MNLEDPHDRIDPRLAEELAELRSQPVPEPDWDVFRNRLRERAEPLLARRRLRGLNTFGRPLIPIAAAASIAFAVWLGPELWLDRTASPPSAAVEVDDESLLIEALVGDLSEQEFRMIVTGRANPEALLAVAVTGP